MPLSKKAFVGNSLVGMGLGLLVGLLIGMSVSPIVVSVTGALVAGVVAWMGFAKPDPKSKELEQAAEGKTANLIRLGFFSWFCVMAVLTGIYLRTHHVLGESMQTRKAEWVSLGFSEQEARDLVALRENGHPLPSKPLQMQQQEWVDLGFSEAQSRTLVALATIGNPSIFEKAKGDKNAANPWDPVLFSIDSKVQNLPPLNPSRFSNVAETLQAYRVEGGAWEQIAQSLEPLALDDLKKRAILDALWAVLEQKSPEPSTP